MKRTLLVALLLILVSFPAVARYKPMTLAELKANSDVIALVDVAATKAVKRTTSHRTYSQECTVSPVEVLKGQLTEGEAVLRGCNFACDSGTFESGQRYLIFLKRTSPGVYISTNYYNGIYAVQGDKVSFRKSDSIARRVKIKLSDVMARLR